MDKLVLLAEAEDEGKRIDSFVSDGEEELTRSAVQRLCEAGHVQVDGKVVAKNYRLRIGESVTVELPPPTPTYVLPEAIALVIVYEDDELLVVDKPKGMVVHPAPGNEGGTLVNGLLHHCGESLSGIGGVARPGIVHRIDKDTSGLLVVAKTDFSHSHLSAQLQAHTIEREYRAVVYGRVKEDSGRIDLPIGRHPTDRKRQCVTGQGRTAATNYTVVERYRDFTHLSLRLETGRTHQIRVHMAHIHHPVAGDPVYGPKKVIARLEGQCLHARTLGFIHPRTGEPLRFQSALPPYFTDFLRSLGGADE